MKKTFLYIFAALVLFSTSILTAQESLPIALGFRGGVNWGDNSADFSPLTKSLRAGPWFGAYSEFGVARALFITGEFAYMAGGTSLSYQNVSGTFKLDEFVIPVSLKYKILMENSSVKPYLFTGVSLGFVTNSEVEGQGGSLSLKDQTSSTDWGYHIGGGIELPTSDLVAVTFDVRYSFGLVNLDKSGADSKSRNLSLVAGVNFRAN